MSIGIVERVDVPSQLSIVLIEEARDLGEDLIRRSFWFTDPTL